MIAQVIIDIPARQVNRPFDYLIPKHWENLVQVGMRVKVPFGSRQRIGFIVALQEDSDFSGSLKNITEVMELQNFLNLELIQLSEYLANYLNCFQITVIQAMLPSLLKAKYQERYYLQTSDPYGILTFKPESDLSFSRKELEALYDVDQINSLIKKNILASKYELIDQTSYKEETYVTSPLSMSQIEDLLAETPDRYHQQKALLQAMLDWSPDQAMSRSELIDLTGISYQSLKTAQEKGWIEMFQEEVYHNPLSHLKVMPSQAKRLLQQQEEAYQSVLKSINQGRADTYLIQGVTGSGKTEVYLQLMEAVREQGKTAILLVPEISLTPQMVSRVLSRFQEGVAVLHSGLSMTERFDEWQRIIKGEASIVVGARSSIFAPLENIGIIIIDEEHETTYKQGENPKYHARDVAKWRSSYHSCPLVLGSATPSLESRARAQVGNYQLLRMDQRVNQKPLPPVEIIDMTQAGIGKNHQELSTTLLQAIDQRLKAKEQIVLLLNRRGYASYLLCRECGYIPRCPRCDISLTYHKADNTMKCHYCDYHEAVPRQCPQCQSLHIHSHGVGTQKVAESLNKIFPDAKIIRMDNDTTRGKGKYEKLLNAFARHQRDILLGTQMIAKGLDFENVTLVGVINADTALNLPDFRAGERTFQLLTQVSGRAGRGKKPGQVYIQTYNPNHYIMKYVLGHNYQGFFAEEMHRRHLTNYPPYFFTTLITSRSKNQSKALEMIYRLKSQLSQSNHQKGQEIHIVGPNRGSVAKINNYYHYNLLLKYKNKDYLDHDFMEILLESQKIAKDHVYINIDHEPQYFI